MVTRFKQRWHGRHAKASSRARTARRSRRLALEVLEDRRVLNAAPTDPQAIRLFDASPALFAANQGQVADASVRYAFQGSGANVLLTDNGPVLQVFRQTAAAVVPTTPDPGEPQGVPSWPANATTQSEQFSVHFQGANTVTPVGSDQAPTVFNYCVGDRSQWHLGVPTYQKVAYEGLYSGIDLETRGGHDSLKYEFHVAPGADYQQIRIHYEGIDGLSVDDQGLLHVNTPLGELTDAAPVIYQEIGGRQVAVAGQFQLIGADSYTFTITGTYDPSRELVIDPTLSWSTYLGGSSDDYGYGVGVDSGGNALVMGYTYSSDFAGVNNTHRGEYNTFVAKVSSSGSLLWATYLGGSGRTYGRAIAVDSAGNAIVTGDTNTRDFAGANNSYHGNSDAYVAKVSSSGSLLWATYLGGSFGEVGYGIAVDRSGNSLVAGTTASTDFPGANNTYHGGFVAKVSSSGTLLWTTYLGGSRSDYPLGIAVDSGGNALVTGEAFSTDFVGANNSKPNSSSVDPNAFVAEVSSGGTLAWATYLGGSKSDQGKGIAVDGAGNVLVTGLTQSTDFAGANNTNHGGRYQSDAFVAKVGSSGTLAWATYLGGSGYDEGRGIAVDSAGNALVTGNTDSIDFSGANNTSHGNSDAFVAEVSGSGTLAWSTYLGGSGYDEGYGIGVDNAGNVLVMGQTHSTDLAGANNASHSGNDSFLAKLTNPTLWFELSPLFHGTKILAWAWPASQATDLVASGLQGTFTIATGQPAIGTIAWDTTTVPDGLYQVRAVFYDASANPVHEATFPALVNNSAAWHSGTISSSETWTSDKVNVVDGTVTVAAGATLTIQPGAIVKFAPGAHLQIILQDGATLNAAATQDAPLIFTSLADDTADGDTNLDGHQSQPEPGDWSGFSATTGATLNLSQYVQVRYMTLSHSGTLGGNETWSGTVVNVINQTIVVPNGLTLTIQPGAIVKLDVGAGIVVQPGGHLIADGTVAQPIIFTSIKDDSAGGDTNGDGNTSLSTAGDWQWLRLEGTAVGDLDYVQVRYGGNSSNSYGAGGEIELVNGATLTLDNSSVSESLKDGILAGGTAMITNTLVTLNSRGIVAYVGGGNVTVNNCTVDNNVQAGLLVHGGTLNVANTLVSNNIQNGVEYDFGTLAALRSCDVWAAASLGSTNYSGIADPTGTQGNISADPSYKNAAQGDYRLNYLSPAIDAADGRAAPAADLMGNPRYNDPRNANKTGLPDGQGNYPDLGAYEFVESASSNVDLAVTSVVGSTSATVGQTLTVQWTITNLGTSPAIGPWHDAVSLVYDPTGQPIHTPLGEVLVGEGVILGAGQSLTTSSQFVLPGSIVGQQYCAIYTNDRGEVFEGQNRGNNEGVALASTSVGMAALTIGAPALTGQFAAAGESHWYQFTPPAGQSVRISLTGAGTGATRLYVAEGRVPTADGYNVCSTQWNSPSASVSIDNAHASTYYVLAQALSLPSAPASYTIEADPVAFSVQSVTPSRGGTSGTVSITVTGDNFPGGSSVELVTSDGKTVPARLVHQADTTKIVVTFDLSTAAVGPADVVVFDQGGDSQELAGAFQVVAGGTSGFWFQIDGPPAARAGRQTAFTLTWGNNGSADAPMQLIKIPAPDGVTLTTEPGGVPVSTQLLLLTTVPDSPAAVLPPGYTASMQLYVTPGLKDFSLAVSTVAINDPSLTSQSIDWNEMKASCQPSNLSGAQWDTFWSQFTGRLGSTWADLLRVLSQDALGIDQTQPYQLPGELTSYLTIQRAMLSEIANAEQATSGSGALGAGSKVFTADAPTTPSASPPSLPGQIHALTVSLQKYPRQSGETDLPDTWKDQAAWAYFLHTAGEVSDITAMQSQMDGWNPISTAELKSQLATLAKKSAGGTAFFSYSGHGYGDTTDNCTEDQRSGKQPFGGLLTTWISNAALSYDDIIKALGNSDASHIVIVLDACYSGNLTNRLSYLAANPDYCAQYGLPTIDPRRWTVVTGATSYQKTRPSVMMGGEFNSSFMSSLGSNGGHMQQAWLDNDHVTPPTGYWLPSAMQYPQWFGIDFTLVDPTGVVKDKVKDQLKLRPGETKLRNVKVTDSGDPNDKLATGFGDGGFIRPATPITYTVDFQNSSHAGATAPAQEILITDQLSPDLDWSTLQLGSVGFGSTSVDVPAGHSTFSTTATIPGDAYPVTIAAALDPTTGTLTWHMESIDPVTGTLPADPYAGFLPVDDGTGCGDGFVLFSILPRADLLSGTQIHNQARIVFDVNPPIDTNSTLNTMDAAGPESRVQQLPAASAASFTVHWSGTDDDGGSGIATYDVYVSIDGGDFQLWQNGTPSTSATFTGAVGHDYAFQSLATDNVGHRQASATTSASTKVGANLWHNFANPCDVDGVDGVAPLDALIVISYINSHAGDPGLPTAQAGGPPYYDVFGGVSGEGDQQITPSDVLAVIYYINTHPRGSSEGEASQPTSGSQTGLVPTLPDSGGDLVQAALVPLLTSRSAPTPLLARDSVVPWSGPADGPVVPPITENRVTNGANRSRDTLPPSFNDERDRLTFGQTIAVPDLVSRRSVADRMLSEADSLFASLEDVLPDLAVDIGHAWRTR
ncbi:MAG: SBBP repeat-containing protein [Planctomycetota bacterium]|nr:SBBP repeat-containing protein [Planctomycetota bacterium]